MQVVLTRKACFFGNCLILGMTRKLFRHFFKVTLKELVLLRPFFEIYQYLQMLLSILKQHNADYVANEELHGGNYGYFKM